jgi:hypothetical protein
VEIVYPPRNERYILDATPRRGDDYMDEIVPLLEENERLGAGKSDAKHTNDISSLLEENAQLRDAPLNRSPFFPSSAFWSDPGGGTPRRSRRRDGSLPPSIVTTDI